ncbi:hypothetical protein AAHZ94_14430, partial [Streptomyces sp. HSW2009]|uniref:hypothetical protein n=1 Tax=Streptomyces sp. HSW2009 TaxID=3142890 RepID=UPI0032EC01CD
ERARGEAAQADSERERLEDDAEEAAGRGAPRPGGGGGGPLPRGPALSTYPLRGSFSGDPLRGTAGRVRDCSSRASMAWSACSVPLRKCWNSWSAAARRVLVRRA